MKTLVLLALCLSLSSCVNQKLDKTESHNDLVSSLRDKKLLFIGAHPDDELVLMPIFAEACLFNGATCHFVSVGKGELGCFETINQPDLDVCATIRQEEFTRSAAIANGTVEFLNWEDLFYSHSGDGLRRNLIRWADLYGGKDSLVNDIEDVIKRNAPDVIFSLDPRHGSTCNPNHRAVSLLLLDAVEKFPKANQPRVLFENTVSVEEKMTAEMVKNIEAGALLPWPNLKDTIIYYDISHKLPNGKHGYDYQIESLRAHASQFPEIPDQLEITADNSLLRIPLVDASQIDPALELCSPIDLSYYKTSDTTLNFIGRRLVAWAEQSDINFAFKLTENNRLVSDFGELNNMPVQEKIEYSKRQVTLEIGAADLEQVKKVQAVIEKNIAPFVLAPR